MKKIGLFLLIIVVFIAVVWFLTNILTKKTTQSSVIPRVAGVSVEQQSIQEEDTTTKLVVDVWYPKIIGLTDEQKQNQINEKITQLVKNQIDQFKKNINPNEEISEQDVKNGITMRYTVGQVNDRIVSIVFPVSTYYMGAAHPNTVNITFNYDLTDNKELQLKDLFKVDSNYLQMLSQISRQDLITQLKADIPEIEEFVNPGTEPKEENFKSFVLLSEAIKLIFDPYQVAPYVAGTREVVIPLTKMQSVLNPTILK